MPKHPSNDHLSFILLVRGNEKEHIYVNVSKDEEKHLFSHYHAHLTGHVKVNERLFISVFRVFFF